MTRSGIHNILPVSHPIIHLFPKSSRNSRANTTLKTASFPHKQSTSLHNRSRNHNIWTPDKCVSIQNSNCARTKSQCLLKTDTLSKTVPRDKRTAEAWCQNICSAFNNTNWPPRDNPNWQILQRLAQLESTRRDLSCKRQQICKNTMPALLNITKDASKSQTGQMNARSCTSRQHMTSPDNCKHLGNTNPPDNVIKSSYAK